jgi:recombination protein RecR
MAERLRPCSRCWSFAEDELCPICADPRRDPALLCVVEEPSAILPIERTHEYRGYYHVLGGALSPIDGVDPDDLRIEELVRRIDTEGVREVVMATNPTMTGEATALYLADLLRGRVRLTRLASGLPVGADLEHADELTLGRALLGRRELEDRVTAAPGPAAGPAPGRGDPGTPGRASAPRCGPGRTAPAPPPPPGPGAR